MNDYFYLDPQNNRQGPVSADLLISHGVTDQTLVWKQGMTDWIPAGQVQELAPLFAAFTQATPPPHAPYSQQQNCARPQGPAPDNYLIWAILSTICCCLPFGIVSIVYSAQVNSQFYSGRVQEAQDSARKAKNWAIASAVTGAACSLIYIIIYAIVGVATLGF